MDELSKLRKYEEEGSPMDKINPRYYRRGKFETIDVILDVTKHLEGDEGYLVGNIIKYLSRYDAKNGLEDIEKARWYARKLSHLLKEKGKLEESELPTRPEVSE